MPNPLKQKVVLINAAFGSMSNEERQDLEKKLSEEYDITAVVETPDNTRQRLQEVLQNGKEAYILHNRTELPMPQVPVLLNPYGGGKHPKSRGPQQEPRDAKKKRKAKARQQRQSKKHNKRK